MPKRKRTNDNGSEKVLVKFKGVSKSRKKFMAIIRINVKHQYLGTFDTPKEAAQAYDLAAIQAGRPISKLNFLDQVPKNYKPKKKKLSSGNTTGFRGVDKIKGNRFRAQITIGGKKKHLGHFTRARDAAMAYDEAIVKYHQPRTKFNFPEGMPIEDQSDDDDGFWA